MIREVPAMTVGQNLGETGTSIDAVLQALLRDRADVVACSVQHRPRRFTQVLVELELHAVSSIGIGT